MDCLQLLFVKGGSHGWRFDYRIEGKRKMLSLGTYPDTSLAAARRKAEAARELVAEGFDPSKKRQAEKAAYVQARAVEARRGQGLPPLVIEAQLAHSVRDSLGRACHTSAQSRQRAWQPT